MATYSTIAIRNEDGTGRAVCCTHDGYPDNHAPLLLQCYTTPEQVNALLDLGELGSLGPTPESCDAFHRDQGDDLWLMQLIDVDWTGHRYLYDVPSGVWLYATFDAPDWVPLADVPLRHPIPIKWSR
tara:strand:+ start:187 stop:567 length:381 start_codon:yes stop_codon:yes gene_type:complete